MTKKTITLHLYESTNYYNAGRREVFDHDFRGNPECMKGRLWLGQQDVEIDWPDADTRELQVEALKAEVQQERADSQVRINFLLERISKLQAIRHDGGEASGNA